MLSLVGVFLAVSAMTSVTALGQLMAQAEQEQSERWGWAAATVAVQAFDPTTGEAPPQWDGAVSALVERYGITGASNGRGESLYPMPSAGAACPRHQVTGGGGEAVLCHRARV